jgi:hypothetical protein
LDEGSLPEPRNFICGVVEGKKCLNSCSSALYRTHSPF